MLATTITASFLHLAALPPEKAAIWAVKHELGRQSLSGKDWDLVNELLGISWRESRYQRIGVHDRDLKIAPRMYDKALGVWWLNATLGGCEYHAAWNKVDKQRFVVRGSWGLSGAYNLKYLTSCQPPEVLDIPVVSAVIAVRKVRAHRGNVRAAWSGALKCQERRKRHGNCKNLNPKAST